MRPVPRYFKPVKFWEARGEENMKSFWVLNILLSTGVCGMIFINLHLNVHCSLPTPQWGCPSGSVTGLAWPMSRLCRPLTSGTCAAPPRGSRACARRSRSAAARAERSSGCALSSSQSAVKVKFFILILINWTQKFLVEKVSCHLESTLKALEFKNPSYPELEVTLILRLIPIVRQWFDFFSVSPLEPAQQQLKWRKIFAA